MGSLDALHDVTAVNHHEGRSIGGCPDRRGSLSAAEKRHLPDDFVRAAKPFEDLLASSPATAAEQLAQWRSSFLLRGHVTIDCRPLTGAMTGLYSAQVVLDVELIDAAGNVLASESSSADGKPVRAADTLELGATEKAPAKAVEAVYPNLKRQIAAAMKR